MSPSIAILIPTKQRHQALARTLALARRTGATLQVCDQSPNAFAAAEVLHCPDIRSLPAARNALLRASTADIVLFIDDDTDLAADAVTVLAQAVARWPDAAGWGPILETRPKALRWLHRIAHLGCFHDPRRLTGRRRDGATSALFGACFAVRRTEAMKIGFDERRSGYALGEDLDFCRRLTADTGRSFRFCANLRAIHRCESVQRADARQRGAAKAHFLRWWARSHGRHNPCTLVHLIIALLTAASGAGREPGSWRGLLSGLCSGNPT